MGHLDRDYVRLEFENLRIKDELVKLQEHTPNIDKEREHLQNVQDEYAKTESDCAAVSQQLDEFQVIAEDTVLLVASLAPLDVAGLVHIPRELAMLIVDFQLGGPGEDEQPERGLTEIEAALIDEAGEQIIGALKYSFEGVIEWEPSLASHVSILQFCQIKRRIFQF